jgi:hypothetical protein
MHGNTPHDGPVETEVAPEDRRALRRDLVDVATSTRDLLSDEFVVGGEISDDDGALSATVAVQPPAGSVVSAGLGAGDRIVDAGDDGTAGEADADATDAMDAIALDLAAGAVLEAKHAAQDVSRAAR